jgi:hypothetical protein
MVMILEDGVNRHRLEDAYGNQVGFIRNGTIRLYGLTSRADAIVAAMIVWEALDAALAREFAGWPRHRPVLGRLRVLHDGAYDWIADGAKPLARLLRMPMDRASDDTLAIEFVLPSYASQGAAISAAQVMATAFEDYVRRRDRLAGELDDAVMSGSTDEIA